MMTSGEHSGSRAASVEGTGGGCYRIPKFSHALLHKLDSPKAYVAFASRHVLLSSFRAFLRLFL
jgi:hypothetical protein